MAYFPETYDVVIVGAGPVGLVLSTHLARWGYKIKHIDNRSEPTPTGRADGIQPRSMDMLKNLGLKRDFMAKDPARVYEVAFWDPQEGGKGIHRTGTWASCPRFIDTRHPFTSLLHQGFIERIFINDMAKHGTRVQRPWTISGFRRVSDGEYPVEVDLKHVKTREGETVRAKYLFSGEGGKSFVREKLGIEMQYKDPVAHVWGVMDGVVRTNFPDIKVLLNSPFNSVTLTGRDEMHNPLRQWFDNGHSSRKQSCPSIYSTSIFDRPRLGSIKESFRERSSRSGEKDNEAILDRLGLDRVVLCLSDRARNSKEVHAGQSSLPGRRRMPHS